MRSPLLLLSLIIFSTTNAQIKKGSTMLGGSLNFNHSERSGSTGLNLNMQYAKAYKENNFFGFQAGYGHNHVLNQNWNSYYGGIFCRKYMPVIKDLFLFGEGNLNVGYAKFNSRSTNPVETNIRNDYNAAISLMPGLSYGINSRLHLEIAFPNIASIYYNHEKSVNTSGGVSFTSRDNSFGLNTSSQLNLFNNIQFGFRLLLQKKAG